MRKIAVTYPLFEEILKPLNRHGEVVVCSLEDREKGKLIERCKGAELIISQLNDPIDAAFMDAVGEQLQCICQFTVGYDNIDLEAAKARGIAVSNTPGTLSAQAVAEQSILIILCLYRQIREADTFVRQGKYLGWDPALLLGRELHGKTVGIVGAGAIGAAVAAIAHNGFGARIVYTDKNQNKELEKHLGALQMPLEKLLARADVVSLHVPLLESTRHLIGAEELKRMKNSAILLNLARGPVIDERALVNALQEREIAGAGLDVYENEPELAEGLKELPNVILTPHTGSATLETREAMVSVAVRNAIAFLSGNPLPNRV
jgi:glyoxylate reductase